MTVENPIPGFDIEKFINDLSWSEDTDDYCKTLVAGNLRNLFASLGQHVSPTMSTAEPVNVTALLEKILKYMEGSSSNLVSGGFRNAHLREEISAALSHVQAPLATDGFSDNGTAQEVLGEVWECARTWVPEARIIGNVRAGDIARSVGTVLENLKRIERSARMQAAIMRDPERTGNWEGAEKVADAFEDIADRSLEALEQKQ